MTSASGQPPRQLRLDLTAGTAPDEAEFQVGPSNQEAVGALDRLEARGAWLALAGPAGVGKSLLARRWLERHGGVGLVGLELAAFDLASLDGRPVLLDDADAAPEEPLFHLMNATGPAGPSLLMVARQPPATWTTVLPDLASRLRAVPTAAIEAPDDTVLAALLSGHFARRLIQPPADLIAYLLPRMERSAVAAAAIVEALDAAAQHRAVSRALAASLADQLFGRPDDPQGEFALR